MTAMVWVRFAASEVTLAVGLGFSDDCDGVEVV